MKTIFTLRAFNYLLVSLLVSLLASNTVWANRGSDTLIWLGDHAGHTTENLCKFARTKFVTAADHLIVFATLPWAEIESNLQLQECLGAKRFELVEPSESSWSKYLSTLKKYRRDITVATFGHGNSAGTVGVNGTADGFKSRYLKSLFDSTDLSKNETIVYISESCHSGDVIQRILEEPDFAESKPNFCSLTSGLGLANLHSDMFSDLSELKLDSLKKIQMTLDEQNIIQHKNNEDGFALSSDTFLSAWAKRQEGTNLTTRYGNLFVSAGGAVQNSESRFTPPGNPGAFSEAWSQDLKEYLMISRLVSAASPEREQIDFLRSDFGYLLSAGETEEATAAFSEKIDRMRDSPSLFTKNLINPFSHFEQGPLTIISRRAQSLQYLVDFYYYETNHSLKLKYERLRNCESKQLFK